MAVKFIFLALLTQKPMYGYEMKESFEKMVSNHWQLNFGQVYTTLSRLERDKLVYMEEIQQSERPDKKVYHITEAGKEYLNNWLEENKKWNMYFDDIAFKVALFDIISKEQAIKILSAYRIYVLKLIRSLMDFREKRKDANVYQELVVERNLIKAEGEIKWIDLCLEKLELRDSEA